jgi:hypothetical protein
MAEKSNKEKLLILMKDIGEEIEILERRLSDIRNTRWKYYVEYLEKYGKD